MRMSLNEAMNIWREKGAVVGETSVQGYKYFVKIDDENFLMFKDGRSLIKDLQDKIASELSSISQERLNQILAEEIAKAKAVGVNVSDDINPVVGLAPATSWYGMCYYGNRKENGGYLYMIKVSSYHLENGEDAVRETLMHEVCHAVRGSKGHGPKWQSDVAKVNRAYGYHIQRVDKAAAHSETLRSHRKIVAILKCRKCGHRFERARESNFTKNPQDYLCKCGGNIYRLK